MAGIGKILMIIGGITFVIGFIMQFVNIGRLPGDIIIQKGNTTFYFPIMTSLLLSVILSLLFFLFGRFK